MAPNTAKLMSFHWCCNRKKQSERHKTAIMANCSKFPTPPVLQEETKQWWWNMSIAFATFDRYFFSFSLLPPWDPAETLALWLRVAHIKNILGSYADWITLYFVCLDKTGDHLHIPCFLIIRLVWFAALKMPQTSEKETWAWTASGFESAKNDRIREPWGSDVWFHVRPKLGGAPGVTHLMYRTRK